MRKIFGISLLLLLGLSGTAAAQETKVANSPAAGAGVAAALKVGQVAPDFTLEDVQGHKVSLAQTRGQTPTLIYFFRGWW